MHLLSSLHWNWSRGSHKELKSPTSTQSLYKIKQLCCKNLLCFYFLYSVCTVQRVCVWLRISLNIFSNYGYGTSSFEWHHNVDTVLLVFAIETVGEVVTLLKQSGKLSHCWNSRGSCHLAETVGEVVTLLKQLGKLSHCWNIWGKMSYCCKQVGEDITLLNSSGKVSHFRKQSGK